MDALLNFGIRLVFVLLSINALFTAATTLGIVSESVGSTQWGATVQSTLSDLNASLTQENLQISDTTTQARSNVKESEGLDVGQTVWNLLFGYSSLAHQLLPESMSVLATAISFPLMLLQSLIMFWWGLEIWWKVKPF